MSQNRINLEIEIPTQTRYLGLIGNIGEQLARDLSGYAGDHDLLAYTLNLVLTEALSNVMKYAGSENQILRVCINIEADTLSIQVHDQGRGFDLDKLPSTEPESLSERGRGIFIMRQLMDSVDYRKTEAGNVLEMKKKLA
ncbi:serine/threonine-protein kinase RsbW [Gammaproteobacteria bacterium]|nr:serine/threonine-protein kinase RsbW [Gammaproteobacteria bacterium]